jgi:hypothetical protein
MKDELQSIYALKANFLEEKKTIGKAVLEIR